MRVNLRLIARILPVSLLLLLAVVPHAHAQTSRLYLAGYMGLNVMPDLDFSETTTPSSGDLKFSNAMSFAGALGLRIDNQWRVEGELSYRKADLTGMDFSNAGLFDANGELGTTLLMANVYYDFDLNWKKLTPYVTAGMGLAWHNGTIDDVSGFAVDASDDDIGLAWQIGTGLKYQVKDNMAFTGGYRYLGGTTIQIQDYEHDYSSHEFRVGLEYDLPFK